MFTRCIRLHHCEMIVCMMTPSMEHHQPLWISEASWKAPPRVCFCVSFSKYCSLSLHFLMLCLEQAKLPEAKWLGVGNLLLLVLFLHTYQGKTQLIFQILQKCRGICWWRASVQGMFFHFHAWVPRVLSENLWPQFEQSTHLESHLPAWWTDAASMDSCIPLPTTRYSLFRCFSKSITQGEGNQHLMCISVCLLFRFLGLFVNPCPSLSGPSLSDLLRALSYVSSQVSSDKGPSPSSYKSLDHFKTWH